MSDDLIGKSLGGYTIKKLLGHGGMARVYQVVQPKTGALAALKVIQPETEANFDYETRFQRESQAIEKLKHPNIVGFQKSGKARGVLYLVMEYIDGDDLADVLRDYRKKGKFMPDAEMVQILKDIGAALDYSHQQGVIHRDIKPSNIMIDKAGKAILTDFGLALLAEIGTKGEIFGTPRYISPEQAISSAAVVPQSDLYALGVIAYEMLTGRAPFETENSLDAAMMHMTEKPPPPSQFRPELSAALDKVLLKILDKEAKKRYSSGVEFAAALEKALSSKGKRTTTNTAVPRPTEEATVKVKPRSRIGWWVLGLILIVLVVLAVVVQSGIT